MGLLPQLLHCRAKISISAMLPGWPPPGADNEIMQALPVFSPASPQAAAITSLFEVILVICGVILLVVTGMVAYSLLRFRARPGGAEPRQAEGSKGLEFTWTAIPLVLVTWIFVLTARGMNRADPMPGKLDADLVVSGHQWWWEARYADSGAVTANEIHIPVGQRLLVRLESADVIHDFWAPQLGRKMDMVPGHPNHIWLEADQPGTYAGVCAEYCGTQHAWMRFVVIAQAPATFEAWQREQLQPAGQPASPEAIEGARTFQDKTCANCHAINGTSARARVGPDLTHVGERTTLAAGVMQNTRANLARWLRNPQAFKAGSLMPNLQLTETQVNDLVNYLEPQKSGDVAEAGGGR
jgi:cytochrome c oxidase subunit 2